MYVVSLKRQVEAGVLQQTLPTELIVIINYTVRSRANGGINEELCRDQKFLNVSKSNHRQNRILNL